MHEIESLGAELKESRAMARMLLERAQDGQSRFTAFTERLLMLIDETANVHYESASSPATLSRRLKETLQTGLTGHEAVEQIGGLIETSYPGFLSGLFDDFPWLTDDDRLLTTNGRHLSPSRWASPPAYPNTSRTGWPPAAAHNLTGRPVYHIFNSIPSEGVGKCRDFATLSEGVRGCHVPKQKGDGQTALSPAPSGWGSRAGLARETPGAGRPITNSRRWWRKAVPPGTFRMGFPGRAGERDTWGRSAYNEFEKVVEKGHFARHLLDGRRQEY